MGSDLRCGGGLIHKACTAVRSVARPRFVLTRCKADLVAETSGAGARNVVVAVSNEEDEKKGGGGSEVTRMRHLSCLTDGSSIIAHRTIKVLNQIFSLGLRTDQRRHILISIYIHSYSKLQLHTRKPQNYRDRG